MRCWAQEWCPLASFPFQSLPLQLSSLEIFNGNFFCRWDRCGVLGGEENSGYSGTKLEVPSTVTAPAWPDGFARRCDPEAREPISNSELTIADHLEPLPEIIRGLEQPVPVSSDALLPSARSKIVTMAFLMPVSRRLATRLAAPSSICRQCLQNRPAVQSRSLVLDALRQSRATPRLLARFQSTKASSGAKTATAAEQAKAVSEEGTKAYAQAVENAPSKKRLPEFTSSRAVGLWLLGSAISVFGIVVFGGLTRLTESGCVSSFERRWE